MTAILAFATFITSVISGVLSMAGGMILMGVFAFVLSVPAAMVLHGVAQAVSNGTRVWLYRREICWHVLWPYCVGAGVCLVFFIALQFVPSKGLMFILIGISPFAALRLPDSVALDVERPAVAVICGFVVTLTQMLAGASGPVLDVFYVKSEMTRQQVLGTKGITQTLGHLIKLSYYGTLLTSASSELHWVIFPAVIGAAMLGNTAGKFIVERISDDQFRTLGRRVICAIGAVYVSKGVWEFAGL